MDDEHNQKNEQGNITNQFTNPLLEYIAPLEKIKENLRELSNRVYSPVIIPRHSSETRKYVPFGFIGPEIIVNNAVQILPDASLYHFGVIISNIHMAWMRAICGRIKSDYRYSKDVVYNNFPFPTPTEEQKSAIEKTAQGILDARALYPDNSLADLYDPLTMPPELRKAHEANDRAVEKAYGRKFADEAEIVAYLMQEYQRLVGEKK